MEDSFYQCCKTNQLDKIEQFIPSTDVTLRVSRGFEIACESGSLDVVKFLLEKKLIPGNKAFPYACESGHLDAAKLILATEEVDINILDSYAFRYACGNGHFPVVKFLLEYAEKNNLEIDIHAQRDFAFLYCKREEIINLLLPLLNRNKDEFYFYKEKEYYILKPLDFEMNRTSTKFEHFQVYHRRSTYLNDCIDAYQVYLRRFRKKSAFSMIIDH